MTQPHTWAAPLAGGPVDAVVRVPGSKSLTNRWLVLGALAGGPSTLRHPLRSQDSERMAQALRVLGADVDTSADEAWHVAPPAGAGFRGGVTVDCGQAGTVMRFLPPLAALADGPVRFEGHHSALTRPVGPVLQALRELGVEVDDEGRGTLPFTVHGQGGQLPALIRSRVLGQGRPAPPVLSVDASASSQFVSALLLAAPALPHGLVLRHVGGTLPSLPHIEMTLEVLREVGIQVDRPGPGTWRVEPGTVGAFDVTVEPDLSSAAPFLALAAVTGGRVRVPDWPARTTQPGARMREVLSLMGVPTEVVDGELVAGGRGTRAPLRGIDLDLGEIGELTPVVAALATLAEGPSRLRGIAHLRGHETDRLAALASEITRLGGRAEQTEDGLRIEPGPLHGARLRTYHDHRMAMFAAVVGAVVPGVEVEDVAAADKTFPGFDLTWSAAVGTAAQAQEAGR